MTDPTSPAQSGDMKQQVIKLVLELGPLIVFFGVNVFSDNIFTATAWFMGAMVVSLGVSWLIFKRVAVMPLVTGIVVLVFGGLTLYLQNDVFIKMKPTIVNALFGSVLLGGMAFGQSLLRYVFGEVYHLKERGWWLLTLRWGLFFFFLAIVNEVVWRNFSTDTWVAFKVWGIMPITIIFSMFQVPVLNRYAVEDAPAE